MPWKALLTGDLSHWRTRPKTFTVNFPASDRIERHEVVAEVSIDIGDARDPDAACFYKIREMMRGQLCYMLSSWHEGGALCVRSSGAVDFLTAVHHSALCQQQMCRLLEVAAGPVLDALRARCWEAEVQVRQLSEAVKECEQAEAERRAAGMLLPLHHQHGRSSMGLLPV